MSSWDPSFGASGHCCQVADNRGEVWTMHQVNRSDLIISDWKMPIMDGPPLCREVGQSDPPQCPTRFILGLNETLRLVEGLHAGIDEYIKKPFDPAELEARLEAASRLVTLHRVLRATTLRLESIRA